MKQNKDYNDFPTKEEIRSKQLMVAIPMCLDIIKKDIQTATSCGHLYTVVDFDHQDYLGEEARLVIDDEVMRELKKFLENKGFKVEYEWNYDSCDMTLKISW